MQGEDLCILGPSVIKAVYSGTQLPLMPFGGKKYRQIFLEPSIIKIDF